MKLIILVAVAFVAMAAAAPAETPQIIRSKFDQQPEGNYEYGYETENGIKQEEVGERKSVLNEKNESHDVITVRGSYSYINPEGETIVISYVADENGFRAEGPSIPKNPARR